MEQGTGRRWFMALFLFAAALMHLPGSARADDAPTACPGPVLVFEPLAPGLWLIPADGEVADAHNRGQVVNLLLASHGGRLWLLGSGPSPAFGRALACQAYERLGLRVAEVAIPRARAELALGASGVPAARVWATPAVSAAMRAQCPVCVAGLEHRLGAAATDLGAAPVRFADRPLRGQQGRWGPFEWRQVMLDRSHATTLWRHAGADVMAGFGVLWFGMPPDGRDTAIDRLARATRSVRKGAAPGTRFIGEQGPVGHREDVQRLADYWTLLLQRAAAGVARGDVLEQPPPPALPQWAAHERHGLNWQRAWRQAEDRFLALPAGR